MRLRRVPNPRGWTSIPNAALEDSTMSFRARGLLAYLLSRPADWETDSKKLAAGSKEGRDAIRKALAEIEDARYLFRVRMQERTTHGSTRKGTWTTSYVLFDSPLPEGIDPVTLAAPLVDVDVEGDPIPPVGDSVENPGDQIHRKADRRLDNRTSVDPAVITTKENHYSERRAEPPTSEPVESSPARRPPGSGRAARSNADAGGAGAFTPASSSPVARLGARLGMASLRSALEAALGVEVPFEVALQLLDVEARSATSIDTVTVEDVVRSGLTAAGAPGGLAAAGARLTSSERLREDPGGTAGRARPVPGVGSSDG